MSSEIKSEWKQFPKLCSECKKKIDSWLKSEVERMKTVKVTDRDRKIAKELSEKYKLK